VPLAEPQTYTEAGNDVIAAVRLYKTGYWVGLALVVSQLLVFAMKRIEQVQPQFKKYGTTIILGLSAVTAFLGFLVGGHSVPETVLLFLGTAAPKLLADVMTELGVTPHRDDAAPVAPPAAPPAA
jgi:ABC-type glucose/galactose transport system permease subunit